MTPYHHFIKCALHLENRDWFLWFSLAIFRRIVVSSL